MGCIIEEAVLNYLSRVIIEPVAKIKKGISVEYWKDIVNFTSASGIEYFARYLKEEGIHEIRGESRLVVLIPVSKFQITSSERQTATFCIEGMHASIFKHRYGREFKFISN